jgi:hypothetical protein
VLSLVGITVCQRVVEAATQGEQPISERFGTAVDGLVGPP